MKGKFKDGLSQHFDDRSRVADYKQRWTEMKDTVLQTAKDILKRKQKKQKSWIMEDTLKLTEKKRMMELLLDC
jgi:hypothetical protein